MSRRKGGSELTRGSSTFPTNGDAVSSATHSVIEASCVFLQEVIWDEEILTWTMCRRPPSLCELVIVPAFFHCSLLCSFPVSNIGPQFISLQGKEKKENPAGQEVKLVMRTLSQTLV